MKKNIAYILLLLFALMCNIVQAVETQQTIPNFTHVNDYQWDVYSQSLKAIRPFLKNHKKYIIYGSKVASYDDSLIYTELNDFIIVSQEREMFHVYPKNISNLTPDNIINGNIEYTISPMNIQIFDNWLRNHTDYPTSQSPKEKEPYETVYKNLFDETNYHKGYYAENIEDVNYKIYELEFFAMFDEDGQIHGASMARYKTIVELIPRYLYAKLFCSLFIAREQDQNRLPLQE